MEERTSVFYWRRLSRTAAHARRGLLPAVVVLRESSTIGIMLLAG